MWWWWCHKCRNFPHILLCWPSHGLSLLRWCRMCVGSCCSGLGHHSCIVRGLVLVRNISIVAWLWCNDRWCWSLLWLLGDRSYDAICSMGCPRCIAIRGSCARSVWDDGVQVSRMSIDEVKLLSFQYGLQWELGLKEPIQEDPVVKLYFT